MYQANMLQEREPSTHLHDDAVRLLTSQLTNRVHAAMLHSHVVVKDIDNRISSLVEEFISEHEKLLYSLFESLRLGREYEEAFNQRMKLLEECESTSSLYFAEHGEHVRNIERMQNESAERYTKTIKDMTHSLQCTAENLVRASIADKHSLALTSKSEHASSQAELLRSLTEMYNSLKNMQKKHQFGEFDTKHLQEAISLHAHKLNTVQTQNTALKGEIDELANKLCSARQDNKTEKVKTVPESSILTTSSQEVGVTRCEKETHELSIVDTIAQTRRELDEATNEVNNLKTIYNELEREYVNLLSSAGVNKYTTEQQQHTMQNNDSRLNKKKMTVREKKQQTLMPYFGISSSFEHERNNSEQMVRRIVREAMIELNHSLEQIHPTQHQFNQKHESHQKNCVTVNESSGEETYEYNNVDSMTQEQIGDKLTNIDAPVKFNTLQHLLQLDDMEELKAVQNYIVKTVNCRMNSHTL